MGTLTRAPFVRVLAMAGVLALVTALSGCSSGGSERLTVYSGRTENLVRPLLEQFSKDTGIKVDVKYGDSAELALLIETEGAKTPADVFLSQSPGSMEYLAEKGKLQALPAATLEQVESRFRSVDGRWVGLSGRVRVLVYNTEQVKPTDLPQSVFDLTGAAYRGKVAVAPNNGSFQDFVTAMRRQIGDDRTLAWLSGMKANNAKTYANNTAIVQAVARGEIAMGLVNHYYNEQAKAEDPSLPTANHQFASGDLGNLILVTSAGITASTSQKESAQRFVDYMLSAAAQQYFAKETLEYPLAAGVQPAVDLPPLASIQAPAEELGALGDLKATVELINESGLASA